MKRSTIFMLLPALVLGCLMLTACATGDHTAGNSGSQSGGQSGGMYMGGAGGF